MNRFETLTIRKNKKLEKNTPRNMFNVSNDYFQFAVRGDINTIKKKKIKKNRGVYRIK